jgi:ubiquinone/menaquinone biosynthesis C-methylase UbiE
MTQSFDPVQYKAQQKQDWSAVANGWKKWWTTFEGSAQAVSDRLVALAQLQPGHQVLDVATGIGEPAVTAARQVGPTGRVLATDQAPQMLALARARTLEFGLTNIEFREVDAEQLEFPTQSFDAILSRWGLMFLPDLALALQRMHGLLRPGGRLAAAVWAAPQKVPLISVAMGMVRQQLQTPPPPADVPGPFSLAETGRLAQALTRAGFTDIRSEPLTVTFAWPTAEDYTRFQQDIAAPITALLDKEPPERRAAVWQAVTEAARQHADPDGYVRMANEAICVSARR